MQYTFTILLQLFERAALLLMCLFVLTRLPRFKEVFQKGTYAPQELAIATTIFSLFAIFGTYSGINVEGSLVNVRIIAIVSGGILFGPWVGLITGIISGVHRFLIDIGGVTSLPCLITSITAGIVSGVIYRRTSGERRWMAGILAGMACEALTMLLILVMAEPLSLGVDIVSKIAFPSWHLILPTRRCLIFAILILSRCAPFARLSKRISAQMLLLLRIPGSFALTLVLEKRTMPQQTILLVRRLK